MKKIYRGIKVVFDYDTSKLLFDFIKLNSHKFCLFAGEDNGISATTILHGKYLINNGTFIPEHFFPNDYLYKHKKRNENRRSHEKDYYKLAECSDDFFVFAEKYFPQCQDFEAVFFDSFISFDELATCYTSYNSYKIIEMCAIYLESADCDGWSVNIFSKNDTMLCDLVTVFLKKNIQTCKCMICDYGANTEVICELADSPTKHIVKCFTPKKNKHFNLDIYNRKEY